MGLRVAGLGLWLDSRDSDVHLAVPPVHGKFLQREPVQDLAGQEELVLRVRNGPLPGAADRGTPLFRSDVWELWQDEAGRYGFLWPEPEPPRWVAVDAGFRAGEVLGDFAPGDRHGLYPLQHMDIQFYANWLANYGDVILHAAGVAVDEQGYGFVGDSGAGKSTLAASFLHASEAVVLGEDQVILRYLQGRFWIYGTPWHENPEICAPFGVPLKKLFFLDRTASPGVVPCAPPAGVARLMQTAFIPYYRPSAVAAILDRLALLAEQVSFHTLSYQLGTDALELIEGA